MNYEVLYQNIPEGYEKIMEQFTILLYKDFGNNLWNERNADCDKQLYKKMEKR